MNQIIFCLSASAFIIVAIMRVTDPLLPIIAADFGLSIGRASIIVTAFAVPYGLFQLIYGPLGDRLGKLKVTVYTLAASSLFTCACALATSIEMLAALRLLAGIATAAAVPLSLAFIADNFAYAVRQAVIARYLNGLILGQIAGGSLGGIMAELFGWRVIFIVFGLVVGIITIWVSHYAKQHREQLVDKPLARADFYAPYIALVRKRKPRQLLTTAAIEGFFLFGASAFIGAFLHHTFALGYASIGLILASFGIGSLTYTNTAKFIVPRLGERRMIMTGALIMAACYGALALTPKWQLCVPILIVCGFGFYVMHNTLQTLATELAPNARGTAVSLFAFSLMTGQGAGVAFIGPLIDHFGYRAAFALTACAILTLGVWFQNTMTKLSAHTSAPASDSA